MKIFYDDGIRVTLSDEALERLANENPPIAEQIRAAVACACIVVACVVFFVDTLARSLP